MLNALKVRQLFIFKKARCGLLCAGLLLIQGLLMAADFLPPEQAFQFSARMDNAQQIEVRFEVAEDYYLYREKLQFSAVNARLGPPTLPEGLVKFDPNFDKTVEIYRQQLVVVLPVEATGPFTLNVSSQGCSDKGLCYPPMQSSVTLTPTASASEEKPSQVLPKKEGELGQIEASLASGQWLLILPLFLLLGLGLSFTPCVLPMLPILSFIIAGEGVNTSRRRGFVLALAYSFGMALVYTLLGVAAGLLGEGLAATLQSPWVLGGFALLMAAMALSMFDIYQLQMPAALQLSLTRLSERQRAGKLAGVFLMGAISALIVGPCVAAPLAGALVYISQSRNVLVGGGALFAMAMGMSLPLLLLGLSAGTLLPRAGAWMQSVKAFFGVLMLALALWMVASLLPAAVLMLGWGALALGYGLSLLLTKSAGWKLKLFAFVFLLLGGVQLAGLASGGRDPWSPLAHLGKPVAPPTQFKRIKNVAELEQAIAGANGRTVMLDFYADWCVSCIEMEKLTFTDAAVKPELDRMLLLQADVTANNADDKALLKRFGLFGPPGIIFFDGAGHQVEAARVIGFQKPEQFLKSVAKLKSP